MSEGATSRRLTVVIVTYNSQDVLPDCLRSLPEGLAGGPPSEVLVVDNNSQDDTVSIAHASTFPVEVIRTGGNIGYAAALNLGLSTRPGTDLLALNADVQLLPGVVKALYDTMNGATGTGIVVPVVRNMAGDMQRSLRREPGILRSLGECVLGGDRAGRVAGLGEVVADKAAYSQSTVADWATGAAWLVSSDCLAAVGPWDESFFLYSEETDFALRARDLGFDLRLSPNAEVAHLGGPARQAPLLWALLTVNKLALYKKRHGSALAVGYWVALVLGEGSRAIAGDPVRRAGLAALFRPQTAAVGRAGGMTPTPNSTLSAPEHPPWLCFSAQDWWYHNQAHSDFQLLRRVARDRRVLLINSMGLRMPSPGKSTQVWRRLARKAASVLRLVRRPLNDTPNFHVMTPVVIPLYHRPLIRRANAFFVRLQVAAVLRRLGMTANPVIVCTIPTSWDVVAPMRRHSLVYNRSDRHSDFPESDRSTIASLEDALLLNADRVLYVSRSLMTEESHLTGQRAYFLDHGVDLDHFIAHVGPEPSDAAAIPHPRIGFFGSLDDYLVDFELLERLARDIPEAQLVLVGDATRSVERLEQLPNVHLLGFKPYAEIPAYGTGFDVAIMPWRNNEWIERSNPIKMKEYLALGLPIVSIDFPEARQYNAYIRLAEDHATFVDAVRQTLTDGGLSTPEGRRRRVSKSSWDARARDLLGLAEGAQRQMIRRCAE